MLHTENITLGGDYSGLGEQLLTSVERTKL
jgi:hypothetical protein